jgi:hypothetical protein
MGSQESAQALGISSQKKQRATYVFPIPPAHDDPVIKSNFSLVKLNADEEKLAYKKSNGDNFLLASELAKASLVEIDEQKIDRGEGQDERVWRDMDPCTRQLVLGCYAHLHTPEDDVMGKVIAGMKITVK